MPQRGIYNRGYRVMDRSHEGIVVIEDDQIRFFPDFDRANFLLQAYGASAIDGGQFKNLFRGDDRRILMKTLLHESSELHGLKKAVIVAARGPVGCKADRNTRLKHFRNGRTSGGQIHIAAWIVRHLCIVM